MRSINFTGFAGVSHSLPPCEIPREPPNPWRHPATCWMVHSWRRLLASLALISLITACGGGGGGGTPPPPPPSLPSISSFTASSTRFFVSQGTTLTAVFANGTGVVNPGNLAVTSGVSFSVKPGMATHYTLTVNAAVGTSVSANLVVYPGKDMVAGVACRNPHPSRMGPARSGASPDEC